VKAAPQHIGFDARDFGGRQRQAAILAKEGLCGPLERTPTAPTPIISIRISAKPAPIFLPILKLLQMLIRLHAL
jgi:hypothetical protein